MRMGNVVQQVNGAPQGCNAWGAAGHMRTCTHALPHARPASVTLPTYTCKTTASKLQLQANATHAHCSAVQRQRGRAADTRAAGAAWRGVTAAWWWWWEGGGGEADLQGMPAQQQQQAACSERRWGVGMPHATGVIGLKAPTHTARVCP
jgi:hypothetical protein